MPFSVGKIIHDIVDWTHEEIVALEAHLAGHPNRAPGEDAPAPPAVVIPDDLAAALTEIEGLKGQLTAANDQLAELTTKLEAEVASLAGATVANGELQQQVVDLQSALDAAKLPQPPTEQLPPQEPTDDNAFAGETGGASGQEEPKT